MGEMQIIFLEIFSRCSRLEGFRNMYNRINQGKYIEIHTGGI
jgi:hypothetical protein